MYDVTVVVQKIMIGITIVTKPGITIVTKPSTTLFAIPCGVLADALCLAFHATTTLMVCCSIDCECCWKVAEWDRLKKTASMTWLMASAIVGNELLCQLQAKILDILEDNWCLYMLYASQMHTVLPV